MLQPANNRIIQSYRRRRYDPLTHWQKRSEVSRLPTLTRRVINSVILANEG